MPRRGYKKPAHEARTIPVNVRLTPHEKKQLDAQVEASDVTGAADFIRLRIAGVEIKSRRSNGYAKLVDELARLNRRIASIDNNMNQLARMANSGHRVSEIHLQETINEHRQLKVLAADVLQRIAARR